MAARSEISGLARREIVATLTALLEAGVAAGRVRDDVEVEDVLAAIGVVWNVPQDDPEQARRVLRIVIDGLLRPA